MYHNPVLLKSTLDVMRPSRGEKYLDLTAGYGGHAKEFLRQTQNYKDAVLVDRDDFAIKHLTREFNELKGVQLLHTDFYSAVSSLVENGKKFDLILIDLGVSSPQLDNAERGFSYRFDAPLDMRMDREQDLSAFQVVNDWRARDLADIFVKYGELREGQANLFARKIVESRPVKTTYELARIITGKTPSGEAGHGLSPRERILPRIYQAIRIAVNDELRILEATLPLLPDLLKTGGRIGIISFHSLEDRLIKEFMKERSNRGLESDMEIVTPSPIFGAEADTTNQRSRSARFRVARKIAPRV